MKKHVDSLKEINMRFEKAKGKADKEEPFDDRLRKLEPDIAEIVANALTVALAQVENLVGEKFESSNQALSFTDAIIDMIRRKYRGRLAKSMRRFDRLGSHRTAVLYRKSLEKL
jgi:hypothetical protein